MLHRRELLGVAVAAGGASLLVGHHALASDPSDTPPTIVDTNIHLFPWPFRRLPLDEPEALVARLRSLGVSRAWAGSFESLLHRDVTSVNQRLAAACERFPELVPVGALNLELPGWEEDFRRCVEEHDMPAVRLYPNYHGYALSDPRFAKLLERAVESRRLVQIAVAMEDTRTQHPLVQVADVDLTPLPDVMRQVERASVQLLNYRPRGPLLDELAGTAGIYFDTARVEGTDGVRRLLDAAPRDRVLLGTHAPLLIPEAALIRTLESDLDAGDLRAVLGTNAARLLERIAG